MDPSCADMSIIRDRVDRLVRENQLLKHEVELLRQNSDLKTSALIGRLSGWVCRERQDDVGSQCLSSSGYRDRNGGYQNNNLTLPYEPPVYTSPILTAPPCVADLDDISAQCHVAECYTRPPRCPTDEILHQKLKLSSALADSYRLPTTPRQTCITSTEPKCSPCSPVDKYRGFGRARYREQGLNSRCTPLISDYDSEQCLSSGSRSRIPSVRFECDSGTTMSSCAPCPMKVRQMEDFLGICSKRLMGEVCFQLNRRIFSNVFGEGGRFTRFSGCSVESIADKIVQSSVDRCTGRTDECALERLNCLYKSTLNTLNKHGYYLPVHSKFSMNMITKYGLLAPPENARTVCDMFKPRDKEVVKEILKRVLPLEELNPMMVIVDCLSALALKMNMPMIYW